MKISFHGACQEVTGSCHLVDTGQTRFLVDCGMFQGRDFTEAKNYQDFGFDPKSLDFVILTHAHSDHCGRLPKLFKEGFKGPVYSTNPTRDFAEIILLDSAKLILEDSRRKNKPPLYLATRIPSVMRSFITVPYHKKTKISDDVSIEFYDAGHILGSTFVKLTIGRGLRKKVVVFSGDLGNPPVPLLKDTEYINGADVVIIESTYGNRIHEPVKLRHDMMRDIFHLTVSRGGVLMIPTFALERTQELLYELNSLVENKEVPSTPVFLDSPLAIKATEIYKKYQHLFDKESKTLIDAGDDLFDFPRLKFTYTSQQSKAINKVTQSKVIIAGSGMLNGGRILHHLKRYLWDKKNQVLIIGYQAHGTLGRALLDGAKTVRIDRRNIRVKANIMAIGAYSAHADKVKLLKWIKEMKKPKPKKVFIVHGEERSVKGLSKEIFNKAKINAEIAQYGKNYEL